MSFGNTALASAGDRRDGPRRICRVRASVSLPGHAPLPGATIDISRDGMAILLEHPLPNGIACDISFCIFAKGGVQRIDVGAQALNSVFVHDAVRVSFSFSKVGIEAQRMLSEFVGYSGAR